MTALNTAPIKPYFIKESSKMSTKQVLKIDNLSIGYNTAPICTDIQFSVHSGDICCIIGPNGSGKSTLLSALCRQLSPISGEILLDGNPIDTISNKDFAKKVSILTTQRPRTDLTTCREIVESGRYPYTGMFGRLSGDDRIAVDRAMREAAVSELADQFFSEISDGQKQRVMLAKAFAQETDLLILDEPTSFLDVRYRLEFLESLSEKVQRDGISVVMSVHEIDIAGKIADTVVCLGGGRMQACGGAEIVTDELVQRVFRVDKGLYRKWAGA